MLNNGRMDLVMGGNAVSMIGTERLSAEEKASAVRTFNEATKADAGKDVIVHIQVFEDRTFAWKSLGQPVDDMIREAIGIKKGSAKPHTDKVGKITRAQLEEIAKTKMEQLNAIDLDGAVKVIAGSARSMGVEVVE